LGCEKFGLRKDQELRNPESFSHDEGLLDLENKSLMLLKRETIRFPFAFHKNPDKHGELLYN